MIKGMITAAKEEVGQLGTLEALESYMQDLNDNEDTKAFFAIGKAVSDFLEFVESKRKELKG